MDNKIIFSRVFGLTKPFHKTILRIIFSSLLISSLDASNSYFISQLFNLMNNSLESYNVFFWCSLIIFGAITRIIIVNIKDKHQIREYETKAENHFDITSISKYLSFSNGQHINQHSGVKQNIVVTGINSIRGQMGMVIFWLTPFVTNFIASITILMTVSLWLGLYYLAGAIALGYFLYHFHHNLEPKLKKIRDIRDSAAKIKSDIFRHATLIKNEVADEKIVNNFKNITGSLYETDNKTWAGAIDQLTIVRLIGQFIKWSSIFAVILFYRENVFEIGDVLLVLLWSDKFIEAVWVMIDAQKQFITDKVNVQKYFELLDVQSDIKYSDNPIKENLIGDIEFKDVCFHYPNREKEGEIKPLLTSLSFKINHGEKIGFVGESGSGKSTIANLMRRAFDPQSGSILTNGHNLKDIDIKAFLRQIGSVEQDVILFDKSIRENISFGLDRLLTDEELNDIAKSSGVHKFYHKLEKGWDTTIGEGGCKLSGGEKQRVGIARAIAKKPQILIFDEATSALDMISEREVQEAIDKSCNGKTAIVIAHRLSTVKDCDRIFVMKDGKLLAADNHNNLLQSCEYYQTLVKNQMPETI